MATKAEADKAKRLTAAYRTVNKAVQDGRLAHAEAIDLWSNLCEQLVQGNVGFRWRIVDPALNVDFTEDDLTLADADVIKQRTGCRTADVEILEDATHYAAVLYAWMVNHQGRDAVDAAKMIAGVPVNRAAECVQRVAVGPDPKGLPVDASMNGS